MEHLPTLITLFFITALVYATVGFGGGSTYLALLVLFHVPYNSIPKIALVCNVLVVSGGLYHYIKTKNLDLRWIFPFLLTSIPFSFLGGKTIVVQKTFLLLLGLSLLIAGTRMLLGKELGEKQKLTAFKRTWTFGLPIGALLGFLSGIVGIGGGIYLSPLMYFLGLGTPKQIAASSSLFIFLNSIAGLWGQMLKSSPQFEWKFVVPLFVAVVLGGQVGSRLSVGKLRSYALQRITAVVVLVAAIRIFWGVFL